MATQGYRRALGQHFLRDTVLCENIVQRFIDETTASQCTSLMEIGPGQGALTDPLLHRLDNRSQKLPLLICERDEKLALQWKVAQVTRPYLRVELADFLEVSPDLWLKPGLGVLSNLPYSVGTAIFTRLAAHPEKVPVMVLMFQSEVAQRLRAEVSTKAWGSLSVWTQNNWDIVRLHHVPPGAFVPPPDVDSEVVLLKARTEPRIQVDPVAWEALLKAAFAHRRKMLRSGLPPGKYRKALEIANLDGTKRAEALDWPEWKRLYEALPKG